jgi:hypothetical protein
MLLSFLSFYFAIYILVLPIICSYLHLLQIVVNSIFFTYCNPTLPIKVGLVYGESNVRVRRPEKHYSCCVVVVLLCLLCCYGVYIVMLL